MHHHGPLSVLDWIECPVDVTDPAFLDVETTGVRPDRRATITEIAVVGRRGLRFHWCSDHLDRTGEDLAFHIGIVLQLLRDEVVVGHNISFDFNFLAYEAKRLGIEGPDVHFVDTLEMARRQMRDLNDYRLGTLIGQLGIKPKGEIHTAAVDALATRDLFWRLVSLGEIRTLKQAGLKRLRWFVF